MFEVLGSERVPIATAPVVRLSGNVGDLLDACFDIISAEQTDFDPESIAGLATGRGARLSKASPLSSLWDSLKNAQRSELKLLDKPVAL